MAVGLFVAGDVVQMFCNYHFLTDYADCQCHSNTLSPLKYFSSVEILAWQVESVDGGVYVQSVPGFVCMDLCYALALHFVGLEFLPDSSRPMQCSAKLPTKVVERYSTWML